MKTFKQYRESWEAHFGHDPGGEDLWSLIQLNNKPLLNELKDQITGVWDEYADDYHWLAETDKQGRKWVGFPVFQPETPDDYDIINDFLKFMRSNFTEDLDFRVHSEIHMEDTPNWVDLNVNLNSGRTARRTTRFNI